MTDGLDNVQKQIVEEVELQLPIVLKLPEPDRSRCILCLAYEYFNLDMEEEGFKLIEMAEADYFKSQMAQDMKTVKDFDKIVVAIMAKLFHLGYIVDPNKKG